MCVQENNQVAGVGAGRRKTGLVGEASWWGYGKYGMSNLGQDAPYLYTFSARLPKNVPPFLFSNLPSRPSLLKFLTFHSPNLLHNFSL